MDLVKTIVDRLNESPFDRNLTVITFDSLTFEDLLQILSDIMCEINDEGMSKKDIRLEDVEHTLARIGNSLQILRYDQFVDPSSADSYRQNLARGDRKTLYGTIEWLLTNFNSLKQRAYLARFLIKVDVPSDILGDSVVASLYQQYVQLVEEFKKTHKENVVAKNSKKISTSELRSDGVTMEKEKEIVTDRIYHIRKKVDNLPNMVTMARHCRNLRQQIDRKKELVWRLQEETANLRQCDQRLQRLSQRYDEMQKRSIGVSSQTLLQKLDEEIRVTSYIVNEKLPRELAQQRREKELYRKVAHSNVLSKADNDELNAKIRSLTLEVNALLEQRQTPSVAANVDDKTVLFRQQAAIVARKKDQLAEKYAELKTRIQNTFNVLQQKQSTFDQLIGDGDGLVVRDSDHFQQYVDQLRTRSSIYKRYRNDLAALKAECGILSRTFDILRAKSEKLGVDAANANAQLTENASDEVGVENGETLLSTITQLSANIAAQKFKLVPFAGRVKSMRNTVRELTAVYDDVKRTYDLTNISLGSGLKKLTDEVTALCDKWTTMTSETETLRNKKRTAEVDLEQAKSEFQATIDRNNSAPSIRDQLNLTIAENNKTMRLLKDEQRLVRENEPKLMRQKAAWNGIEALLRLKIDGWRYEKREMENALKMEKGAETLVLR